MDAAGLVAAFVDSQQIWSLATALGLVTFMWPSQDVINDDAKFDFIIAGGGTAGCTSRLVRAGASVLIVEAGGQPPLESVLPGTYPVLKRTAYEWNMTTKVDNVAYRSYRDNIMKIQQGKLLGGSGQVGFEIFAYGIPEDYDLWAETANDTSWGYNQLSKYIKKIERIMDQNILNSPDVAFHGTNGRIKTKKLYPKENENYFNSYKELGHNILLDINAKNTLGYTNVLFNYYARFRQSTAYAYLKRDKDNPKLFVMYNALATKIIFDKNKKAVGIKILYANKTITVKAGKEVIVTAEVIKSPQLLMLSGIGPKAHLKSKKIPVISNLPVGQNFQDHRCTVMVFRMGDAIPVSPISPFTFSSGLMIGNVAIMTQQTGLYVNNTDLDIHANYIVHHNRVHTTNFFKSVNASVIYPNLTACNGIRKGTVDYWKCYIKEIPTTFFLYFGTNAMGSVVDSQLRVKGVRNLRVGDASVIPNCVGAPPHATVMIVAERLAELLKKTHNLE